MADEPHGASPPRGGTDGPSAGGDGGENAPQPPPGPTSPDGSGDREPASAADPLADAFGAASGVHVSDESYRTWVRNISSAGPATVIGGGSFRDLRIGGTTVFLGDRREQAHGRVRPEILDELTRCYAPVTGYEAALKRLRDTRLVILRGAPGTGRATTGLRLLAEAADGPVARFGPETDLASLSEENLQPGLGYLAELLPGRTRDALPVVQFDRLHALLTDIGCFMVLITPHRFPGEAALDGYIFGCPPPDPWEVFGRAIEFEGQQHPHLADTLQNLAADVQQTAGNAPRLPSEGKWLARLAVSCAAGEITVDDMRDLSKRSLTHLLSGWFEPLSRIPPTAEADGLVRLAAFRIALAVLNDTPFDGIAEAGEQLTVALLKTASPRRTPGRQVFADHRADYIADSLAHTARGWMQFTEASVPATYAKYDDDRMASSVLGHVWNMHNARSPVVSWLQSLSRDPRPFVSIRAALTIGLLSSWDFSHTFDEFIFPWASSTGRQPDRVTQLRRRLAAAIALDAASRNDQVQPAVREILDEWCRKGTEALRWTAAAAHGYDLALQDVAKSLRQLRIIGCWEDANLVPIASWAVARIFLRGAMTQVIDTLGRWLQDPRLRVRDLAVRAAQHIAEATVADAQDIDLTAAPGEARWARLAQRRRWPLVIALAADDPGLVSPLADLMWQLTRSVHASGENADDFEFLADWMRAPEEDRTCTQPVGHFLYLLGDDDSDRSRLLHLVAVLQADPDEPLPPDIADQFIQAIRSGTNLP